MSHLKNPNTRCNIKIIDLTVGEYEEKIAMISKEFDEDVDALRKDIATKLSLLVVQRDNELAAAWRKLLNSLRPYLAGNDQFLRAGLGNLQSSGENEKQSIS